MGVYYVILNLDKREFIEPMRTGVDAGCKFNSIIDGPPARAIAAMLLTRWNGDRIAMLSDSGVHTFGGETFDYYERGASGFRDVTDEAREILDTR